MSQDRGLVMFTKHVHIDHEQVAATAARNKESMPVRLGESISVRNLREWRFVAIHFSVFAHVYNIVIDITTLSSMSRVIKMGWVGWE